MCAKRLMSISKQGWHSLVNFASYLIRFTLHYRLFGIKGEIDSTLQMFLYFILLLDLAGAHFLRKSLER